ncbi:MAG: DUF4397 domain-containing protein [Chitinophagaceae bacterium]
MKKKLLVAIAGFVVASVFLVACKKNDDNSPQQDGSILMINASPGDSVGYDYYFNDVKLNAQSLKYPSNSGYVSLAPKNYTIKIAATNTINPLSSSGNYGIGAGKNYSVFAYDTLLAGKIKLFATEDDLTAPATGKAKVRFFHLSPANVSVDILANDSLVFANRSYADNVTDNAKGNFISVNAGTYTVKVKLAGTPSIIPPLLTLSNITFSEGKQYTIFAKGKVNGTGVNALGAEVIINK